MLDSNWFSLASSFSELGSFAIALPWFAVLEKKYFLSNAGSVQAHIAKSLTVHYLIHCPMEEKFGLIKRGLIT